MSNTNPLSNFSESQRRYWGNPYPYAEMSSDNSLDDPTTNATYAADDSAPDVDFLDESAGYADNYVPDTAKSAVNDSADDKSESAVKHASVEHIAVKHTAVEHTAVEHTTAKHTVGNTYDSAADNNKFCGGNMLDEMTNGTIVPGTQVNYHPGTIVNTPYDVITAGSQCHTASMTVESPCMLGINPDHETWIWKTMLNDWGICCPHEFQICAIHQAAFLPWRCGNPCIHSIVQQKVVTNWLELNCARRISCFLCSIPNVASCRLQEKPSTSVEEVQEAELCIRK
jgi:hypothetical protein